MGTDRKFNSKGKTRPKKVGTEARRRINVHRKRLIAKGVKSELVRKMTSRQLRLSLRKIGMRPTRTKK